MKETLRPLKIHPMDLGIVTVLEMAVECYDGMPGSAIWVILEWAIYQLSMKHDDYHLETVLEKCSENVKKTIEEEGHDSRNP